MVEMKSLSTTVCLLVILFAESKSQSSTSSQTLLLGDDNSIYMPATSSYSDDNEIYGSGDDTESFTNSATSFSVQPSSTVMPSSYSSSTIFSSEMSMTFSLSDTSSTATPTAQFTSSPSSSPLSSSSSQFTQFSTTSTSMSATAQSSTTSTTTSATTQRGQQQANVAITLASPPMNQRDEFEADALRGLEAYYRTQMGDQTHFKSLFIANFMYWNYTNPAGQISTRVTVNYTVVLDNTTEAMGEFAEAHGELITSEHFTALGTNQVVLETTLLGETYSRSDVAGLKNVSCNIFENSINGCPADTDCEVEDDTTRCVPRNRGSQQQANVAITLASPPMNQRDEFEADTLRGLQAYYRRQMGEHTHFKSLVVANFMYWNYTNPAGQISTRVTVNYTVFLDNTTEAMGEFAEAHGELITSEHFTALGTNQVVLETTLLGETYSRSGVTGLRDVSCNIFENSINGCPADTDCEVEDDTTRCVPRNRGSQQQANVAITLASPPMNQRDEFEADTLRGLQAYYRRQMGEHTHFKSLVIANFMYWNYTNPAGQISTRVTVNYTVFLDNTTEAMGEFAEAHGELITSEHFTALGTNQVVLETTLLGETYSRSGVTGLRDVSCNIFENSINGCPADTDCEVEDDTTRCVPRNRRDDWAFRVGLGVGIPLFALLCGIICCCCYICLARRRRRPVERDDESSVKSVFVLRRVIPVRFYTVGRNWPLYGSYYMESQPPSTTWPNPETRSVTDSDVSAEDSNSTEEDDSTHSGFHFGEPQLGRRQL